MGLPDDLKSYTDDRPGFFILTEIEAGALLGALVASLVVYDLLNRLIAWAA